MPGEIAEAPDSLLLRVGLGHPPGDEIFDTTLEMVFDLRIDLALDVSGCAAELEYPPEAAEHAWLIPPAGAHALPPSEVSTFETASA